MKKHLIAAAVAAAFAVPAMAQVTVYGILDLGYHNEKTKVVDTDVNFSGSFKRTGLANGGAQSGNRLGFRGEEDLGGGMKASFTYELQTNPDEAAQALSNRQAFIGLSGGFGTLNLGRMLTLHHVNQGSGDMLGNRNNAAGYLGGFDSLVRQSNLIRYTSPRFSGLTVAVEKGFGETLKGARDYAFDQDDNPATPNTTAIDGSPRTENEQLGVRVSFATGPLGLGVAHETVTRYTGFNPDFLSSSGGATPAGDFSIGGTLLGARYENKRSALSVFATYDLGVAKIGLVSNDTEFKPTNVAATKFDWSANTLSATVPVGALTLLGSAGSGKLKYVGGSSKANAYQIGADYALSKRTNGYALVGRTKWKDTGDSITYDTMSLGLRHQF